MHNKLPVYNDITSAYKKISGHVHRTPVLTSVSINEILNCQIYFKCENFQKIGAFKYRGATNAILCLNDDELQKGVATHSSGNHAQALALAAKIKGTKAYIVMPENSKKVKIEAVKGYGAEIIFCEKTLQSREDTLEKVVKKTGAYFIHSYNNFNIICGQGTSALELLEDQNNLDIVMTPVGGGGLLSGTSVAVKGTNSKIKVFGAEPAGADDACRSFKSGNLIPSVNPKTIADGLLTSLGDITFAVIKQNVDDIITVSEEGIINAMKLIWQRMKIIVEPSSAVPLAVIMENNSLFSGQKIGIIISGGNVDLEHLPF